MDAEQIQQGQLDREKHAMEQDFIPSTRGAQKLSPELRIANALEYIAFQLGQINRKLDKTPVSASPSYQDKLQADMDALDRL